ncbi:MAG: hypothetical protein IMY71_14100 [Bacteroidetes bacterium]|nr:hypothetical protein [Bacteroidota bacterium]
MIKTTIYPKISIFLIVIVAGWYGIQVAKWRTNEIINHDVVSYYAYLPAAFIYHDLSFEFKSGLPDDFEGRIWTHSAKNGNQVLKMTMGNSLLWTPFFLAAHGYAHVSEYQSDGYSLPYSIAIFIAGLFYLAIGLIFLNKTLKNYFNDLTIALVLILLVFGTNLLHYAVIEPGMSHVYSFCLFNVFLFITIKWNRNPSWSNSLKLGLLTGLIILVRPSNIIVVLVPLLWGVAGVKSFKAKLQIFFKNRYRIISAVFVALIVFCLQIIYWKSVTGDLFYYSYGDEGFFFLHPHVIDGLFSYRKGWLIYTPVMLFALFGFRYLRKQIPDSFWPVLIFLIINIYLVFSWWCWWYGGSFGSRIMVDSYAFLSLPLAAVIQKISEKRRIMRSIFIIIFGTLVWVNLFQMRQYRTSLLHWDSMSRKAYWGIFLKSYFPEKYQEMLDPPDYEEARGRGK